MPSVTLHLVLADRVLDRLKEAPFRAPFDPFNANLVNAFYQGALGPDLGYFPGGHRILSDLAHLVCSGELTRNLVRSAESPRERAFAWGWVTHVLGDQTIHPLVGRGVGELLYGDREIFIDGAGNQMAHVQIETGLDAFYSHLFPALRYRKMSPVFNGSSIRFLVRAYQRTYGAPLDPILFLSSHLSTVRMSVQGLLSIGVMSTAFLMGPVSGPLAGAQHMIQKAVSVVKGGLGRKSLLMAYLTPVPPSPWLVEGVGEVVESFGETFCRHYGSDLRDLRNYNLDTGQVEEPAITHPGTLRTLETLHRWNARNQGLPLPPLGDGMFSLGRPRPLPAPAPL
jgi:hypothetical protein